MDLFGAASLALLGGAAGGLVVFVVVFIVSEVWLRLRS